MLVAAASAVDAVVARFPLASSTLVTGVKALVADVMVQKLWEARDTLDRRRCGVFWCFGCGYQGVFQYIAFNSVLERAWPGRLVKHVVIKVAITNAILDPCFFFPTFYTLKEALHEERLDAAVVTTALSNYHSNYWTDWLNSWSVWLPGHLVTYGLVPVRWRMPWVASVSFGYVALLSVTRGSRSVLEPQS